MNLPNKAFSLILLLVLAITQIGHAQEKNHEAFSGKFVHPGMFQGQKDLEFMKKMVLSNKQPWKNAFDSLKKNTDLNFKPEPQAHISVGAYGVNSNGGRAYSRSASMVYNHALMWYITGDQAYANKAIEILNAWSPVLWDFDDNNAKLNVGLSGPYFLNAAEILKYSNAGWKAKDMEQFKRMVLTVFYPTIKDFFTEANGNWDASMINTLLCIGIYTDKPEIFNSAVERFYRGPGNSGITKYIYPNGQIQETTRDWGHVQLGLGEFAKAAQVAWTQGLDFYSASDNRLALGFEYASKFMLGGDVPVYGVLSTRDRKEYRDIYESLFDHYTNIKGIDMPFTAKVITEHTRPSSSIGLLSSVRAPVSAVAEKQVLAPIRKIQSVIALVGALPEATVKPPADAVVINPGQSIQDALNANAGKGKWIVLAKGIHILKAPLVMPSNITLAGQGNTSILVLAPNVNDKTIMNKDTNMHDVTIRDLLIEGAINPVANTDPNADRRNRSYMSAASREGVIFSAERSYQMRNIRFENLTVQNFTKSGVSIRGAREIEVNNCDFSDNGANVVPGAGFHHNLQITRASGVKVTDSRFDTSPWGNGIDLSFSHDVILKGNEAARNKCSGIKCTDSKNVSITENLTEGNDEKGIALVDLMDGNPNTTLLNNYSGYNGEEASLNKTHK